MNKTFNKDAKKNFFMDFSAVKMREMQISENFTLGLYTFDIID